MRSYLEEISLGLLSLLPGLILSGLRLLQPVLHVTQSLYHADPVICHLIFSAKFGLEKRHGTYCSKYLLSSVYVYLHCHIFTLGKIRTEINISSMTYILCHTPRKNQCA